MWERPDVRTFAQQGSPSAAALVAAVDIYMECVTECRPVFFE